MANKYEACHSVEIPPDPKLQEVIRIATLTAARVRAQQEELCRRHGVPYVPGKVYIIG